jgi:hypothetical protein
MTAFNSGLKNSHSAFNEKKRFESKVAAVAEKPTRMVTAIGHTTSSQT